jgi:hypothetical protein
MNARIARAAIVAAVLGAAVACGSTRKTDPAAERRAFAQVTRDTTLAELDAARPGARAKLDAAPGWAVFSTVGARMFVGEGGGGVGVAHDAKSGAVTYMRMSEPDSGEGAGQAQFRAVFVFRDEKTFRDFVDKGWQFPADESGTGIDVIRLADGGVVADPAVGGMRFWRDRSLN